MLVLSRRVGDSIAIGDDVVVTILDVRSDLVRVGIDAPRHVKVHRAELLAQLASGNAQAVSPDPGAVAALTEAVRRHRQEGQDAQPRSSGADEPPAPGRGGGQGTDQGRRR